MAVLLSLFLHFFFGVSKPRLNIWASFVGLFAVVYVYASNSVPGLWLVARNVHPLHSVLQAPHHSVYLAWVQLCAFHTVSSSNPQETCNPFGGIVLYTEAATGVTTIDDVADVTDIVGATNVYNAAAVSDVVVTDVADIADIAAAAASAAVASVDVVTVAATAA